MGDNIKVAVRVRPFNERETGDKNNHLIVKMANRSTYVLDPKTTNGQYKQYSFDYSYWSHDGYTARTDGYVIAENGTDYVDQEKIFTDLGVPMLENAMEGYNATIFAYGQTGSGKSYSIMGSANNKGIVPRFCENLFKMLSAKNDKNIEYEVTFAMVEIYQEKVRDLLSKMGNQKEGLMIKENPKKGFYVHGMKEMAVTSEEDVSMRIKEGDVQRTIAATKMNETSSRAHTVVTLVITQKQKKENKTKIAKVILVDLAGSERQNKANSDGDRFEEAKKINQSLACLGKIILSLSSTNMVAAFRESKLTMLLKNAIGGNSKTVMLATISPSNDNYAEIISTLDYAKRAKLIKNEAVVNSKQTDKMIKDLLRDKERLLHDLDDAKINKQMGYNEEEIKMLKEEQQLEINRYTEEMKGIRETYQKKLDEREKELNLLREEKRKESEERKKNPHLWNLNEDPALNGKLTHLIKPGESVVGSGKNSSVDVTMHGHRVTEQHAKIVNTGGTVSIVPLDGLVRVNGHEVKDVTQLEHQDRVIFGNTNVFVFHDPIVEMRNVQAGRGQRRVSYEMSQREVAESCGIDVHEEDSSLQTAILSILPKVQDANAMAVEMERTVSYDICLIAGIARGDTGGTELQIKMSDEESQCEHMLSRNDFINRYCAMREMYLEYEADNPNWNITDKEKDPFWEPSDRPFFIGVTYVPLSNLSYLLDLPADCFDVHDYTAQHVGDVQVSLLPCDVSGNETVDLYIREPDNMMGKDVSFKIKINKVIGVPQQFIRVWCKYRLYHDEIYTETLKCGGANPVLNHSQMHSFAKVKHEFVDYLSKADLAIEVWGIQDGSVKQGKTIKPELPITTNDIQIQLKYSNDKVERLVVSMVFRSPRLAPQFVSGTVYPHPGVYAKKTISSIISARNTSLADKLNEIQKIVDAEMKQCS